MRLRDLMKKMIYEGGRADEVRVFSGDGKEWEVLFAYQSTTGEAPTFNLDIVPKGFIEENCDIDLESVNVMDLDKAIEHATHWSLGRSVGDVSAREVAVTLLNALMARRAG